MRLRWEYMQLVQTRDWRSEGMPHTSWIAGPGDSEFRKHDNNSTLWILQELGAAGWELIAGPDNFTGIVGIAGMNAAGSEISVDGADWFRREFWLKREVFV